MPIIFCFFLVRDVFEQFLDIENAEIEQEEIEAARKKERQEYVETEEEENARISLEQKRAEEEEEEQVRLKDLISQSCFKEKPKFEEDAHAQEVATQNKWSIVTRQLY